MEMNNWVDVILIAHSTSSSNLMQFSFSSKRKLNISISTLYTSIQLWNDQSIIYSQVQLFIYILALVNRR